MAFQPGGSSSFANKLLNLCYQALQDFITQYTGARRWQQILTTAGVERQMEQMGMASDVCITFTLTP